MNKMKANSCFYKIVLSESLRQNKLSIPENFVKVCGDGQSNEVTLKVPNGLKWKVKIVKSDGLIWLEKGWKEFAEYYSIRYGSFLLFRYKISDSQFNVTIFDKTASEIDYPHPLSLTYIDDRFQENEVSVEILDHFSPFQGKGELLEKLRSPNPSFKAQISSVHLNHRICYVPKKFVKEMKRQTNFVTLKVNGRMWLVKLIFRPNWGVLSAGWGVFARENSLQVGDVCTFELIHQHPSPLINVSIIRKMHV